MLLTRNLIDGVEEKYTDMLQKVNIPDFYKCIAEFSGLSMDRIDEKTVKEYLITWAKNKYKFYKMLGNKLRVDQPFKYAVLREDIKDELNILELNYPAYAPWLEEFNRTNENIIKFDQLDWSAKDRIKRLFPNAKIEGCSLTRFFKHMLNAPDELVTRIASIFENDTINATYTLSIDPVDMMLASENPYNWVSCYRLETFNTESHADGCLASVLDDACLIAYVWNREGKFDLYEDYNFKSVRYKKMRQWIAISEDFTTIHFNSIYPAKRYEDKLEKQFREKVEQIVSSYKGISNMWKSVGTNFNVNAGRNYKYGYGEFSRGYMYHQSDVEPKSITVYTEPILCPCGCGKEIIPSDEGRRYLGEGFTCEGYGYGCYCEHIEDYCEYTDECCCENCSDCPRWQDNHPMCDLDETEECPNPDWDDVWNGYMHSNSYDCYDCPHWKACYPEEEDEDEDE